MQLTGSLDHLAAGTGETPACLHSWLDVGHFHHNVRETSQLNGGSHVHTMSTGQMSGAPGGPGSGFRLHQRQGGGQEPKWPQAGVLILGEGFRPGLLPPPWHTDPEGASCPLAVPLKLLGESQAPVRWRRLWRREAEGWASWERQARSGEGHGAPGGPGQRSPSTDVLRPSEAGLKVQGNSEQGVPVGAPLRGPEGCWSAPRARTTPGSERRVRRGRPPPHPGQNQVRPLCRSRVERRGRLAVRQCSSLPTKQITQNREETGVMEGCRSAHTTVLAPNRPLSGQERDRPSGE